MTLAQASVFALVYITAVWPCQAQKLRSRKARQDADANMNGEYVLSQTPGGNATQSRFPKQFKEYPGDVQYFEVYGDPITLLYSQIFWKALPPIQLPKHIVDAFQGKDMAVIGWEADQVRRTAEGDISVPISVVYNHHYGVNMIGEGVHFEKVRFNGPDDPRLLKMMSEEDMGHGFPQNVEEHWMVVDDADDKTGSQAQDGLSSSRSSKKKRPALNFDLANGGEFRKSFHGFAPGFAKVIRSPTQLLVTPMAIDTWNRDEMDLTHPVKFVPGPLPRTSQAPANASHSGLLECPLTTRIRRVSDAPVVLQQDLCQAAPIVEAHECQQAAERLLNGSGVQLMPLQVGQDAGAPSGCSIRTSTDSAWRAELFMNTLSAGEGAGCGQLAQKFAGAADSIVEIAIGIDIAKDEVTLNLTGPGDVWFGVAFNDKTILDSPWTVVVDANGDVSERKLDFDKAGDGELLEPSVKVLSSLRVFNRRKVVLTRPLKGLTAKHFTFYPRKSPQLDFISAVGSGHSLTTQRKSVVAASSLALLPVDSVGHCVCIADPPFGTVKGTFEYIRTNQSVDVGKGAVRFGNTCPPEPYSDLLAQKNPTCDFRTYVGGVAVCAHGWSLLDADQPIPWPDQPLTFQHKFRFWVQEYNVSYHEPLSVRQYGIVPRFEYDVPKCGPGKAGCQQRPDGTWTHTVSGTFKSDSRVAHIGIHCHAATCLSVSIYRCPGGTEICNASNGELLCREEPGYGNGIEERFDEPGYIFQPPCLWGSKEYGLDAPPDITGSVLGMVKISNATYGHYGEMCITHVVTAPSRSGLAWTSPEPKQVLHGSPRSFVNV